MKNKGKIFSLIIMMGLVIIGCSNDNDMEKDTTSPKLLIQSPILLLNYSTDIGNSNVPYKVTLTAQGADEKIMSNLKLIVTDSNGNIVLEKVRVSNNDSQSILKLSEEFETSTAGNYNAEFIATDKSGNISSESLIFTYED